MLEETFTFYNKDEAMDFINTLRQDGVKPRIETGCICHTEHELLAPLGIIRRLSKSENTLSPEIDERVDEVINRLKMNVERFFGEAYVGDLVKRPVDYQRLISSAIEYMNQKTDSDSGSDEQEKSEQELAHEKELEEAATYMNITRLLIESGMLREEEDGWRVIEEIDHEKICLHVPRQLIDTLDTEMYKEVIKKMSIETSAIPEWRVITPPSFLLSDIIDDLEDILNEYDMEEGMVEEIINSIQTKELIIESIFRIIKEKGVVSEDEIISWLTRQPVGINSREGMEIIAQTYYNPIVIEGIIQDLKKMNYLKGKPEKLRLA